MNSHCGFRRLTAACLFLLIIVVMGQAKAPTTQPADKGESDFTAMPRSQLVQALLDIKTRQKAHRELWRRAGLTQFGFPVPMDVVTCPQPTGKGELSVILFQDHSYHDHMSWDFQVDRPEELFGERIFKPYVNNAPGLAKPSDVKVAAYTQEGEKAQLNWHNPFPSRVAVMDINGDGLTELITNVGRGSTRRLEARRKAREAGSDGVVEPAVDLGSVRILEVYVVSEPLRPILVIFYNWKGAMGWDYALSDIDNDGVQEIVLGPKTQESLRPEVTFVWDKEKNAYAGPKPSPGDHFRQINPLRIQQEVNRFLANPPKPVDPKTTSRPASRPVSGSAQSRIQALRAARLRRQRDRNVYRIPEDFWTLSPKQAAMALAEANRSEAHRQEYLLALDDRGVSGPPESCTITLSIQVPHTMPARCRYSLYVDPERSYLTYQESDEFRLSFGTGTESWTAGKQYELSYKDAKHVVATIWWLYRIRTWRTFRFPEETAVYRAQRTSIDGRGTLSLVRANGNGFEVLGKYMDKHMGKRCWLSRIPRPGQVVREEEFEERTSGRWGHYNKETYLNLALPVMTQILFDRAETK